jgi:hypothetical protein
MRRRTLLVVVAVLAVVVAAGVVLWPRPPSRIAENFLRIQFGMTRTEVHAILGPPGITLPGIQRLPAAGQDEGKALRAPAAGNFDY